MNILKKTTAAALCCVAWSSMAYAADPASNDPLAMHDFYVELLLGGPVGGDLDHTVFNAAGAVLIPQTEYDPDGRFGGAIALGKYFDENWRAEIQVAVGKGEDGTYIGLAHTGDFTAITVTGNVLYSFDTDTSIRPFVGAGLGFTNVDVSNVGAVGGGFTVNDSDTAVTAALIAGFDFPITETIAFTTRYTGAYTGELEFDTTAGGLGRSEQDSTFTHAFTAGLRFSF